jgi:hypothetical protein
MRFQSRVFQLAKDTENPQQYEDACRLDAPRGTAAIADGVSAGIFSGAWAEILTAAVVADPPDPDDPQRMALWLAGLRQAWAAGIDHSRLAWFQKAKLKQGAFSTLLWLALEPASENGQPLPGSYRLRAWAIGDSCLFHLRAGQLLRTFPLERCEQFQADPLVIGSLDLGHDDQLRLELLDQPCSTGDLLVLATDALAAWAMRQAEAGHPPSWDDYWDAPAETWQEEIIRLRSQEEMRYDDTTLVLLRVTDDVPAAAEEPLPEEPTPEQQAAAVEPAPAEEPRLVVEVACDPLPPPPPLAQVVGQAETATEPPALPPPPPPVLPAAPPVLSGNSPPPPDWAESLSEVTQQVADVTDQVLRRMKKFAEIALQKYRDKFPPKD